MNWKTVKEFLRPSFKKVLLTIFVVAWLAFSIFFFYIFGMPFQLFSILAIVLIVITLPFFILTTTIGPKGMTALALAAVLQILYWYLLTCFLIWFHSRYKKQIKNVVKTRNIIIAVSVFVVIAIISIYLFPPGPDNRQILSLIDSMTYCTTNGQANIYVRNDGTSSLITNEIKIVKVNAGSCSNLTTSSPVIVPRGQALFIAENCESGSHTWRMKGPNNAIELRVFCP
jgi:glucan phosphoethanolaminetransferase (alkaline phosphatase superfamily)